MRQLAFSAPVGHAALPAQKLDFEAIDFEAIELDAKPSWRPSLTPVTEGGAHSSVAAASLSAATSPPSIPRELSSLSAAEFGSIMQLKKLQAKAASEAKDARNAERDFEAIELEAAAANPVEPSVPASVSVPHCPWIPHRHR